MTLHVCPGCDAPLTGSPACPGCGLRLSGPHAVRLYQVDLRLQALDGERTALLSERERLLAVLRSDAPAPPPPAPPVAARQEASPQSVQNTLLALGALLLALAGIVFTAVTYQRLGVVGRAAVLLALTAAAGTAPVWLRRRGLTSSAEAVGAVAVVLGVLDAFALRRAGFLDDVDASSWAAGACAVLAAAGAAWSRAVPLRTGRLSTCVVAQLPVLFVLDRVDPESATVVALVVAALGVADLLVADRAPLAEDVRLALGGLGGLALVGSFAQAVGAAADGDGAAGLCFLAYAALAVVAGLRREQERDLLLGSAVALLAVAAWVTVRGDLSDANEPLVGSAVALLALQATALLPTRWRTGPVLGAGLVATATDVTVVVPVLEAVGGPFAWLVEPWSRDPGSARASLLPTGSWHGSGVTPVVLAAAAACAVGALLLLDRTREALAPAAVLLVLSALVLPLGLDLSYAAALVVLLVLAAASCVLGGVVRRELHLVGGAVALSAAAWSVADETATLVVLPVVALLAAAVAVREAAAASYAALVGGAALAAHWAARDLSVDQVGALLLVAPAACVGLSFVTRRLHLELSALALAAAAVLLTTQDAGWLSWSFALTGVMALAVAIRPDRREVGLLGGLLLSASSWVRLAEAGVTAPEPYVAPVAVAALVFGVLRRRATRCSSFEAYGPGLSVALLPSLVASLDDAEPTRGLVLLVVAVGVVLLGVRGRLLAPLAVGGGVIVLEGMNLLAPYAAALPRWSLLAAAGVLLVAVGATYEQRLRDVTRLRETLDSWA